ncbi:transketolase [Methylacidimicrobium cyclopophantes]|uniref:Transketolase n=1 Tax=Methylacidimicrobium cyclopophantes TaxID=1041766 RepID=A0A5E6M7P9_9BACT|nr:transketolase [Methylacidimicrobium cyclopophantes]VVM05392.1 transketolase [Methylacidimicrobium cyclopophantes]
MSSSPNPSVASSSSNPPEEERLAALAANVIRGLAMDGVQKANSGHPGMPMGMADAAVVLWTRFLRFDPADPHWPDRDRFVLSAGHGSMLLYSLLHLCDFDLPMAELESFRQWGSRTPGHPEYGHTVGVETTTGPLGQGIANAVGMALAERWLAARYNRPGHDLVNHRTYVIASDGDLEEGVSHEAASLAGHLRLGKLVVLYDDNHISIDGPTSLSFSEDVLGRFAAYGWNVRRIDGLNRAEVASALAWATSQEERPTIIACRTIIGWGSPNRQNTAKAHGEPLGAEEVKLAKERLGLPVDQTFYVPEEVRTFFRAAAKKGAAQRALWLETFSGYRKEFPVEAEAFEAALRRDLPPGWDQAMPNFPLEKPIATRAASGAVLNAIFEKVGYLLGGSGDLTPSNNTLPKGVKEIRPGEYAGGYVHYGIREHGMGSLMNGMAVHGGIRPYGGTFLIFSDYMRPPIRLAAMMRVPVVYVFTHDSIGLGEDGPTHQPVEQLTALRAIPNLVVFRPADATETAEGWRVALERKDGPTALILTRQALPVLDRDRFAPAAGARRGGYVLTEDPDPEVILIATGSEVSLALGAKELLGGEKIRSRVVSLPSWELFAQQPEAYLEEVLPARIRARVSVEAGVTLAWKRWLGTDGEALGIDHFGASAPYATIYKEFGLTKEAVADAARRTLARIRS